MPGRVKEGGFWVSRVGGRIWKEWKDEFKLKEEDQKLIPLALQHFEEAGLA